MSFIPIRIPRTVSSSSINALIVLFVWSGISTIATAQEDLAQTPREWILSLEGNATKLLDDFSDTRFSNGGGLSLRHHVKDFRGRNGSLYLRAGLGFHDLQWRTDGRMLQYYDSSVTAINDINRTFAMPFSIEALWRKRIGSEAELFLGGGLELTYYSPMNNSGTALPKPQEPDRTWTLGIPITVILDYMLTDHFSLSFMSTLHPTMTDYLDGLSVGDWADTYLTVGVGLTYAFPEPDKDSDYDGLLNRDERIRYRTNPYNDDTDGDGLRDNDEITVGTSPLFADTDGDGLRDGDEVHRWGSNPLKKDSDDDGLEDLAETVIGSSPVRADSDSDGLNDSVEQAHGTDPLDVDTDDDGLPDGLETQSSPLLADTDGDGLPDGKESAWSLRSYDEDFDADGLYDGAEIHFGTDPKKPDTDNDGVTDYAEIYGLMSDPTNPDSDGDDIPDGRDPSPVNNSTFNPQRQLSWVFMEIFTRGNTIDENAKGFVQMLHLIRSAARQQVFEMELQVFGRDMTEARARRNELERFLRKLTGSWDIPVITAYEDVEDTYYDARLRYIFNSGLGK